MGSVRIITDSACDLPRTVIDEYRIDVVPLTIRFGADEFTDGVDLSAADFWKRCSESKELPETAAPSPGAFHAAYERAVADGCDAAVVVALSSALSATYQAAVVGAEALKGRFDVRVVDSRAVTAAQGLLALDAAVLAQSGASADAVEQRVRERAPTAGLIGTLNTLDHLVKGGRVSGAKAMMGSLLNVKPMLTLRDGLIVDGGRQRTRARALSHLCEVAERAAPFEWLAVGGGDASDLDVVSTRLEGVDVTHPLVVTEIGPVVGTHGGPGVVGVCWLPRV